MLLLKRGATRPPISLRALAGPTQLLFRSRGFRAPSAFELFKPAWLSRLTGPVSTTPSPPSPPLPEPLSVTVPRSAPPPDGPLSDQDFYRLPSLEQTRHGLSCPVPKTPPALREPRLAAVIFGGDALKKLPKEERNAFYSAYHPERLEFVGDRLWYNIIAETVFILSPVEPLVPPMNPTLKNFQSTIVRLATNDLGAKLAKELGLSKEPLTNVYSIKRAADSFETYLAALLYSNGRRALLEFLVPLVKREYFRLPQHRFDALPPLRTDKESSTSEPPPRPVSPPAPSPSPTTIVPAPSSSSSTPPPPSSVAPPPATARSSVDPSPAALKTPSADPTTPKRPPSEPVFRFADEREACQQILEALHAAGLSIYLVCHVNASIPGGGRSWGTGRTFERAWLSITAKVVKLPTVIVIDKTLNKPLLSSFPLRYPTIDAKCIASDLQHLAPTAVKKLPSRVIWSIELSLPNREKIKLGGNYPTYGNAVQKFVQRCISRGVIKVDKSRHAPTSPASVSRPPSSPIHDFSAPVDPAASASTPVKPSTSSPDTKVAIPTPAASAATSSAAEQSEKAGILLMSNSQFRRLKRMKKMDPIVVKSVEGLEDVFLDMLDKRGVPFSCYASFNQTYILRLPGRRVIRAGLRGDFAPVIQCALRAQVIQVASPPESISTIAQQVKAAQDFSPSKLNTQSRMDPLLVVSLERLEDHLLRSLDESGVNFKARSVPHTTHYSLALPGVLPVECGSKKQGFRPVVDRLVQLELVKLVGENISSSTTSPDSLPTSSLSTPTVPPPSSPLSNPSLPPASPAPSPLSTSLPPPSSSVSPSPSPAASSPPSPPSSASPSCSPSSSSSSSPPASSAWEGDYFKLLDKLQDTGEDELAKGKGKTKAAASLKKKVEPAEKRVDGAVKQDGKAE